MSIYNDASSVCEQNESYIVPPLQQWKTQELADRRKWGGRVQIPNLWCRNCIILMLRHFFKAVNRFFCRIRTTL